MLKKIFNNKIGKEIFWSSIAKGISIACGMFFLFFIPKFWGASTYGEFSIFLAYTAIVEIFFGNSINPAVKKEVSEYKFKEESKIFFLNGIKIKLIFFIIGIVLFSIFVKIFPIKILNNNLVAFFILLFLMNFWGMIVNVLEASHRLFFVASMYFVEYSVKIILLIFLFFGGKTSFESLLFVFIIGYLVAFLYGLTIVFIKFKINLFEIFKKIDFKIAKKIIKRAFFLALTAASFTILAKMSTLIIGHFKSVEDVGFYSIASDITRNAALVSITLILGIVPMFAGFLNTALLKKTIKYLLIINLTIFAGFFLFSDFAIKILYGNSFGEVAGIMKILGLHPLFLSLQYFSSEILILKDGTKKVFINSIFVLALNLALNLILIKKFGVNGVALSTVISYFLWAVLNFLEIKKLISRQSHLQQL